jgi:hypothetical protein
MSANAELLWMLATYLALTALPGAFAACLGLRGGLRGEPLLLALALAASGAVATLTFWAFYADPLLGRTFAFLIAFGSLQGIYLCWRGGLDLSLLRSLATPLALWAMASGFVVFLGFLHGGTGDPLLTASTRFSHALPYDNDIPRHFADWFYVHGHEGKPPLIGDWLSSDRPPLQIGYVLAERPFGWDDAGLRYQVIGVVIQQLWVVGLWAALCAARLQPRARGLAIVAAAVGDVAIIHGFYVWPKLIAAAFLLAAFALVVAPEWERYRRDWRVATLFAALCGFAMLAHGSSAFFIVPLLGAAALRGMPDRHWVAVAAAVGLLLLVPWASYQRLADPPGDRLVKWHLGGSLEIDDRSSLEAIVDGYRDSGLGGTLDNKWGNVKEIIGIKWVGEVAGGVIDDAADGQLADAGAGVRSPRFYSLLPMLGLLLLGPLAMAVARARGRPSGPEWSFALSSLAICGVVCAFWALAMYGGEIASTSLHVGALAVPLLAACACVVGAYAVSPRFAAFLVGLNVLLVLALYVPSRTPLPDTSFSPVAAVLAALFLAGFFVVALRRTAEPDDLAA